MNYQEHALRESNTTSSFSAHMRTFTRSNKVTNGQTQSLETCSYTLSIWKFYFVFLSLLINEIFR